MAGELFAQRFAIGRREVGRQCPVFIIAEAGVAHFGSEEKALRLVDLAVEAKADAVKFQIFDIDALISVDLPEWRQRLASRQLPYQAFERIAAYSAKKGIQFLATAHDDPSLDFLVSLRVPAYKIGSGEVGNWPFLRRIAALGKPVLLSLGMYDDTQIAEAIDVFAQENCSYLALLHCVTQYPTAPADAALGNIARLKRRFAGVVGYSDHTSGVHLPLVAVALGAAIIEKHITLDYHVPNAQDWKVSCGPADFAAFIAQIRDVEAALRERTTGPTAGERDSLQWASKSLVTTRAIAAASRLTAGDVIAKRPGTGISPSRIGDVIGRALRVPLERDVVLKWEHLE